MAAIVAEPAERKLRAARESGAVGGPADTPDLAAAVARGVITQDEAEAIEHAHGAAAPRDHGRRFPEGFRQVRDLSNLASGDSRRIARRAERCRARGRSARENIPRRRRRLAAADEHVISVEAAVTLDGLFRERARSTPDLPAYRYFDTEGARGATTRGRR